MMTKKLRFYIVLAAVGFAMLALGLVLVKLGKGTTLPYLSVGFGCGIFGQGIGEVISRRTVKNHPELKKQQEIEEKDERNIAIRCSASAKAFRLMIYVYGALFFAFAMMNVELRIILLLVGAYIFVCGAYVYYYSKLSKEM